MQNNGLEQFDRIDLSEPTKCEKCGAGILSGRFCASCMAEMGNSVNANTKSQRGSNITGGFGMGTKGQSGAKRFEKK